MDKTVKNFYNKHYKRFDVTRVRIWRSVKEFVSTMKPHSTVLDVGCGNGKNMDYMVDLGFNVFGIDFSDKLVDLCNSKGMNVNYADMRNIPFSDNSFDYVVCIAVLHHLEKESDRIQAINEMLRVCKDGGKILVCVWSVEQEEGSKRDFVYGDNMVKWEDDERYYFIYDREHIEEFVEKIGGKELKWEMGNWYFVIEK